jgi:hypothetical protein
MNSFLQQGVNFSLGHAALILLIIVIACLALVVIVFVGVPLAIRKGIPIGGWINTASSVVNTADSLLQIADRDRNRTSIPELVVFIAKTAVTNAEQLWKIGQLDKSMRKAQAELYIKTALAEAGVDITPSVGTLISGAIDSAVFLMNREDEGKRSVPLLFGTTAFGTTATVSADIDG